MIFLVYVRLMNTPQNNLLKNACEAKVKTRGGKQHRGIILLLTYLSARKLRFCIFFTSSSTAAAALVLSFERKAEGVLAWKWFFFIILCFVYVKREMREKLFAFFFFFFRLSHHSINFIFFGLVLKRSRLTPLLRGSHTVSGTQTEKWNGNEEKQSVGSRKENLYLHLATCTSDLLKQIFLQSPKCWFYRRENWIK